MKLVIALVAFLAVVSRVSAVAQATCTLSGDPHWVTFDGVYHDFQGRGTFVLAENHQISVHMTTAPCNPAAPYPVTCLQYMTVAFWNPSDLTQQPDTVQYGNFLGSETPLKIWDCSTAIAAGAVCPAAPQVVHASGSGLTGPYTMANGNVVVTWDGANIVIQNSGVKNGFYGVGDTKFSVTIGNVYGALSFPKTEPWEYSTIGLCGYFNGDPTDDFSNSTAFQYLTSALAQRFNGPAVNLWATNFEVCSDPNVCTNAPLPLAHHKYWNEQGKLVVQNTVPAPYIPTPAVQATLNSLLFPDLVTYDAFAAMCNQVTSNDVSFQNCMYDAAAVPDFISTVSGQNFTKSSFPIAQSNGMAQNIATLLVNPAPQTITSTNNALAIGLGVGLGGAALIALVVAVFYWNRYRFVDGQYSKALIQLNGGATKGTKGEGRSAQAEIRLEDNL